MIKAETQWHASSQRLHLELGRWLLEGVTISDMAALALAAQWQSPGAMGPMLAQLASTHQVDYEELLADIGATQGYYGKAAASLDALINWAQSKTAYT